MQYNFVVDSNGAGAILRMDKNVAIIGKFTLPSQEMVPVNLIMFLGV